MVKFSGAIVKTIAFVSWAIAACSGIGNSENTATSINSSNNQGTLTLVANGEDFVRQGFVTKDNWNISFERVAVNVGNVIAYQTEPAFTPEQDGDI